MVPKISSAALDFYRTSSSSIVTDSLYRMELGAWMDDVHPVNRSWKVAGRARTIQYAPKSGMKHSSQSIYSVCESVEPGDVLVIATGETRGWLMGENMAHFCMYHHAGGIVTDGKVRDCIEIASLDFPVFCRGFTARPFHTEVDVVSVDMPVLCGGGYVRPGDLVVGDADGVVIVPWEIGDALVQEAEELNVLEKEQEIAIRDGAPLKDIQEISRLKKVRKGPVFNRVARQP